MKKLLCILFMIIISLFTVNVAFAHSGRTDSKGGHSNHSTGEYHYHHGYGEHQHDDGFCPIEPENEHYYSDWYKFKIWLSETYNFMTKTDSDYEWRFSDYLLLVFSLIIVVVLGFYGAKIIYTDYQIIEWIKAFHIAVLWAATVIVLACHSFSFEFVKYNEDGFVTQWVLCIFIMLIGTPVLYIPLSIAYWLLWHALSLSLRFIKFTAKHTMPILKEVFDKEFQRAIIITGSILLVALIGRLLSEIWN